MLRRIEYPLRGMGWDDGVRIFNLGLTRHDVEMSGLVLLAYLLTSVSMNFDELVARATTSGSQYPGRSIGAQCADLRRRR